MNEDSFIFMALAYVIGVGQRVWLSQPHFGQVWRWNSHSQSWGLGVLRDSRMFKVWQQRPKHSDWGVLDVIGKVLKCRCPKWPRIGHLDICSPSYGQKKGRESNWQFDSRPQKVGNRPLHDVCRWSVMGRWKALEESYIFGLDLIVIGGWSQELWVSKVPRVQSGTVLRFQLGSLGKKSHSDVAPAE